MWKKQRVSVILLAYNEEESIGKAVSDFVREKSVDDIIVVDNNSTDNTAELARRAGAQVVSEKKQGYGFAIRKGLSLAKGDLIITCEPDSTFTASDTEKFLLYSDDFDVVLGTRTNTAMISDSANMGFFLRWGNIFVAKLLAFLLKGPSLTDVGCTFKLIKKEALSKVQNKFSVGGSHFSVDFVIECLKNNLRCVEVPVHYGKRVGQSKITGGKWKAFILGLVMISFILKAKLK